MKLEERSSSTATLPGPPHVDRHNVQRLLGMTVPVSVQLAERDMSVETILAIRVGTIIEFSTSFDSEQILRVADHPIGRGQAVKVGEHFGLRITHIASVEERIESLHRQD